MILISQLKSRSFKVFYTLIKLITHLNNTYCLLIKVLSLKVKLNSLWAIELVLLCLVISEGINPGGIVGI